MQQKRVWRRWLSRVVFGAVMALAVAGCKRSAGVKEAPITGKPIDPPVAMPAHWPVGQRCIYRVEASASTMIPRRTTGKLVHAETTFGQDLAFAITNDAAGGDGRTVLMEVLALQMETSRDDGVTLTFDSDNKMIFVEDNPVADRLQKLVGLKLRFQLSPENKVTRVDGLKEMNDRMQLGGNAVRGLAAEVIRRFFNQQFFRDILEMGMFPKDPVKIGDKWTETRQVNMGLFGVTTPIELNYTFRGWQRRDGTNCARIDFTGLLKPGAPPPPRGGTNQPPGRPMVMRGGPGEEGTLQGQTWYNPDLELGVETTYGQTITRRSAAARPPNPRRAPKAGGGGTNTVVVTDPSGPPPGPPPEGSPPPPAGPPPDVVKATRALEAGRAATGASARVFAPPNAPGGPGGPPGTNVVTSTTNTYQWQVSIKLLEVEPGRK